MSRGLALALGIQAVIPGAFASEAAPSPPGQVPNEPYLPRMPADVVVETPAGTFHVAPPAGMCTLPPGSRAAVARTMPGLKVVLAGVWCDDVTPAAVTMKRAARRSIILAVPSQNYLALDRTQPQVFLRNCFLQFSPARGAGTLTDAVQDFNAGGYGPSIAAMGNLGVLGLVPGVVFGGVRTVMDSGDRSFTTTTVQACVVLSRVPVFWLFQATIEGAGDGSGGPTVDRLLAEARVAVATTIGTNVR